MRKWGEFAEVSAGIDLGPVFREGLTSGTDPEAR